MLNACQSVKGICDHLLPRQEILLANEMMLKTLGPTTRPQETGILTKRRISRIH